MPNLPTTRPRPGRPANPVRHPVRWLRYRWHEPNPHTESKLHRSCRDFARHFRALRVQLPVFYFLGGISAVAGGIVASSEHLDALAIGEWGAVGLIVPPALVCLGIFSMVCWRTPTRQRDDARDDLLERDAQIEALEARVESLTSGGGATGAPTPQIGEYHAHGPTTLVLPNAGSDALKQLGLRLQTETAVPQQRELRPQEPDEPQVSDRDVDDDNDGGA